MTLRTIVGLRVKRMGVGCFSLATCQSQLVLKIHIKTYSAKQAVVCFLPFRFTGLQARSVTLEL